MKWFRRNLKDMKINGPIVPMKPVEEIPAEVKVVVRENGYLPYKESDGAACYDLFMPEDFDVPAKRRSLVKLRVAMQLPEGWCADIRPRSGNSSKGMAGFREDNGLPGRFNCDVLLGTIDADYRGEIGVILSNHGVAFKVKKGQRIAQMLIHRVEPTVLKVVERLDETKRGEGGFESTGTGNPDTI